jgi:hypothetical protein
MPFAEFSFIRQKRRRVHLKPRITRPESRVFPALFALREGEGGRVLVGFEKRVKDYSMLR